MKKFLIISIIVFVILVVALCAFGVYYQNAELKNGKLYIDGNFITDENVYISVKEQRLPLIKVFEALGGKVDYEDSNIVKMTYDEKVCFLDMTEKLIWRNDMKKEALYVPFGAKSFYHEPANGDFLMDDGTLAMFLSWEFGIDDIRFYINLKKTSIEIKIESKYPVYHYNFF